MHKLNLRLRPAAQMCVWSLRLLVVVVSNLYGGVRKSQNCKAAPPSTGSKPRESAGTTNKRLLFNSSHLSDKQRLAYHQRAFADINPERGNQPGLQELPAEARHNRSLLCLGDSRGSFPCFRTPSELGTAFTACLFLVMRRGLPPKVGRAFSKTHKAF